MLCCIYICIDSHSRIQGVPIRLELGPKDLEKGASVAVRRDTGAKSDLSLDSLKTSVPELLETIQADMLQRARDKYNDSITVVENWADFVPTLNKNHVIVIPWCESEQCEDAIKDRSAKESVEGVEDEKAPSSGAKSLCIPHDQSRWGASVEGKTCPQCGDKAKRWTLFGRSCESDGVSSRLYGAAPSRAQLTLFACRLSVWVVDRVGAKIDPGFPVKRERGNVPDDVFITMRMSMKCVLTGLHLSSDE